MARWRGSPLILLLILLVIVPVEAGYTHVQCSLTGHGAFRHSWGSFTFEEHFANPTRQDGASFVIELNNIALPPGTELFVFVHNREVGTVKLDKKRNVKFVMESVPKKPFWPRVKYDSAVEVKLADGTTVAW